jgi:ketosteroid isomerase-like protein
MTDNRQAITNVIQHYFSGTYYGDAEKLRKAFHADAVITGNFQGILQTWPLDTFIQRVTHHPTSAERKENYAKEILFIDLEGDCAMVKAKVQVGELWFIDYITLLKVEDYWVIRNKSFTVLSDT